MPDSLSRLFEVPLGEDPPENPIADEVLEEHLSEFSRLIEKYSDPHKEFEVYQLSEDEKMALVMTNNQLRTELTARSRNFRIEHQEGPLYSKNVEGKLLEIFDFAMNTTQARERGKAAAIDDDETFRNPYITALRYLTATIQPLVGRGEFQPEIFTIVIDTLRGFDHVAKKRLEDMG